MLMLKIEFIMEDILEKEEKLTGFELGSIKIYFNGNSYILKHSKYFFKTGCKSVGTYFKTHWHYSGCFKLNNRLQIMNLHFYKENQGMQF